MVEKIRIQKFLSQKGLFSRRQVEDFIRKKRLKVNGDLVSLGDRVDGTENIYLDGELLDITHEVQPIVLAFYKPLGMETTLKSIEGVMTLANVDFGVGRVFPIGRLDKDSQGLLLLTNDGDLANKLMHPRYQKEKEYLVSVHKKIDQKFCSKMEQGLDIEGKPTAPCKCSVVEASVFSIILKEGRNRQIRRMCGKLDYQVLDLLRVRFGDVELGALKPGEWKEVTISL